MTRAPGRPASLRRGAWASGLAHVAFAAISGFAATDSDGRDATMFGLLALAGLVGAAAALLLHQASQRSSRGWGRVNVAVSLIAVAFAAGAAGALVGGTFAALLAPLLMLLANGMLVGVARAVQSSVEQPA